MNPMRHRPDREPRWLAAPRALLIAAAVMLAGACGPPQLTNPTQGAARPAPPVPSNRAAVGAGNPAPAAPDTLRCTASGNASAAWLPPDQQPAGTAPIVSAAVGGDTFTLTFARGTPAFRAQPQPSAQFSGAADGAPVTLPGSAGVAIRLTGFRGDMVNYRGPQRLTATGALLREVRQIGDFEGTVSWAASLATPGCVSVDRAGSTLAFRFIPLPPSGPLLAVVEGGANGAGGPDAADLVGLDGRIVARATFLSRNPPYLGNVAARLQPDAQTGQAGVYVMDGNGVVHLLQPSGRWEAVATFATTPERHEAWFAVSPDGGSLLAGVLSVPAPDQGSSTAWSSPAGRWTFDLESAAAGGQTRVLQHRESATWPNQPGSGLQTVFPVGWTVGGPVAMVGAPLATQNLWPGGPLFTIDDGRLSGRVAGDCTAASVLPSGLVPCTTLQMEVTVRDAAGDVLWRPDLQGFSALALKLAPSGDAITNGRVVALRGSGSSELPAGFVAQGWLDSATLAGRAASGDVAYVRLDSPGTVHDLGVRGDFVGAVPAAE